MSQNDLYKDAGVDMAQGDHLVEWLQQKNPQSIHSNSTGEIMSGIGGFAGIFRPNLASYKHPLLVASTDGVGTKLLLAIEQQNLHGVGIDLVAMCVNDLYCIGARPMFFVDYYATGILDPEQFKAVLSSIKQGLHQCQTPLLGGETAELPGLYAKSHLDLAGFVVGIVDEEKKLNPKSVLVGDKIFALPSSGFHSNGYSLIRKWLGDKPASADLMNKLLTPTKIYDFIPDLITQLGNDAIHAIANITGGGISGNLPRVLPSNATANIEFEKLPTQPWMRDFILSHTSTLRDVEPVFNLGAGMLIVVKADKADQFINAVETFAHLRPVEIGSITAGSGDPEVIYI